MASQHLTAAEIDVYLQRIAWGHSDGLKPSLEVLARLMRLHQVGCTAGVPRWYAP